MRKMLHRAGLVAAVMMGILAVGLVSGLWVRPARAISLRDVLLVGGIVVAVNSFGGELNSFINRTLGQRNAASAGATKVVPIFSVGRGLYVGAAQVVGLPQNVRSVRGVATVELSAGNLRGTGLVPISTRRPSGGSGLSRVGGVGINAIIDFRI